MILYMTSPDWLLLCGLAAISLAYSISFGLIR